MPAYPTHTFFSHLALQALIERKHPLAEFAQRHAGLFRVAGIAGADIQCMPYQVCDRCKAPYRHDQRASRKCLVCGESALRDFSFRLPDGREINRRYIEENLYANTHLVIYRAFRGYGVPREKIQESASAEQPFPRQVIDHLANCLRDARQVSPSRRDNYFAFILGWFSHVVSDALFKGVYPRAVRVDFFGKQYDMAMLPAAETLTVTDLAYDFGVNWPAWRKELLHNESDGGALEHLTMGDPAGRYDPAHWSAEFGKPDPAIGRIMQAVPPINRRWFHEMYVQPDYSAASPRLDAIPFGERARARFREFDLGQLRRYAIKTGWYQAFTKGVDVYMRAVDLATQRAAISRPAKKIARAPARPSFALWRRVIEEANPASDSWGSEVRIEPGVLEWLAARKNKPLRVITGEDATDYQRDLARVVQNRFRKGFSQAKILIGPPQFNQSSAPMLCVEDTLRAKYESGLAALARAEENTLLLAGLSDFGDARLLDWLRSLP